MFDPEIGVQSGPWIESMSSPQVQLALWVVQPALQAVVAAIVFRRKLHKNFPTFLTFMIAQVAIFAVEFPVYRWGSRDAYFYVFWLANSLNLVLEFKIIHEIFLDIFRPYHGGASLRSGHPVRSGSLSARFCQKSGLFLAAL